MEVSWNMIKHLSFIAAYASGIVDLFYLFHTLKNRRQHKAIGFRKVYGHLNRIKHK